MNLINPNVNQTKIKALAMRAVKSFEHEDPLEVVYALCLALASASSSARVEDIKDVLDQVKGMHRSIEAARPSDGPAPRVKVVSNADFKKLTRKYGIDLD